MTLTQITKIRGAGIHTTSNIVSHNINSSGIITAVAFKGPFTGSSNIQSGILTATKIDLNGDIDVDGHTNLDNVNVAGVATFTGDATFSGNVSIGGTLTYEDVTNIDSVGIITARDGLKVLAGGANVVGVITATTFKGDGDFVDIDVDGHTNLDNVSVAGVTTHNEDVTFTGATSGRDILWDKSQNRLEFADNAAAMWGTDEDLLIYQDNSNSYIDHSGAGDLRIRSLGSAEKINLLAAGDVVIKTAVTPSSDKDSIVCTANSGVSLYYNDAQKLQTTNTGAVVTGILTATTFSGTLSGGLPITNGADNRVITASSASAIQGEANLTFNGSQLTVSGKIACDVNSDISMSSSADGQLIIGGNGYTGAISLDGTAMNIYHNSSSRGIIFGINETEKIRIDSSGRLRVANTNFSANGDGDTVIIGTTSGTRGMTIVSGNNNTGNIFFGDDGDNDIGGVVYNHNGNTLNFRANGLTRATVSSTAFWVDDGTNARLKLAPDSATLNMIVSTTTNNGSYCNLSYQAADHIFKYGGTEKARLTTTGNYTITGEFASAQDYPNIRPTLDLNFAAVKKLDSRITYSRTGPASYVDKYGLVQCVGANTPRFDHDPLTKECKGLLIEASRTNMFAGTSNMGTSIGPWIIGGNRGARGANVKGPDGKLTALQNIYNGTNGDLNIYYSPRNGANEMTTTNDTIYTCSIFIKGKPGNSYLTGVRIRTYGQNISVNYNVVNGTVVGTQENAGSDLISSSIEEYPDGWYRCIMTFRSGTDGNQGFQFYVLHSGNNGTLNSSGANGEAIYYWGAQLEQGSYATSFIPTDLGNDPNAWGPTTRGADFAYLDGTSGTDFDDIYNTDEGTFVIDWFNNPKGNHNDGYVLAVDDGTGSNRIAAVNSNNYQVTVTSGGSSQGTRDLGSINSGDNKIAFTYKLNDQATSLNGSDASVDTSCTLPTGLKYIWFGLRQGAYDLLGGYISRIIYYPTRLPNNQLKNLSS